MKKILALLLAVICLFSVLTVGLTAAAEDDNQDPIYAIVYEKGGVPVMYLPAPSVSIKGPGWITVTTEKPVAAGYEFMYWVDKDGNRVDPGDKLYVTEQVVLRPHFVKLNDGEDHTTHTIKGAFQALIALFERLFKFFRELEIFNNND